MGGRPRHRRLTSWLASGLGSALGTPHSSAVVRVRPTIARSTHPPGATGIDRHGAGNSAAGRRGFWSAGLWATLDRRRIRGSTLGTYPACRPEPAHSLRGRTPPASHSGTRVPGHPARQDARDRRSGQGRVSEERLKGACTVEWSRVVHGGYGNARSPRRGRGAVERAAAPALPASVTKLMSARHDEVRR